jgi:hypothetical protein
MTIVLLFLPIFSSLSSLAPLFIHFHHIGKLWK